MSEFLKFAYELLSQVVYNLVVWLAALLKVLVTGWAQYFLIFITYFPTLSIPGKILSVLLMLLPDRDSGSDHCDRGAQDHSESSAKSG